MENCKYEHDIAQFDKHTLKHETHESHMKNLKHMKNMKHMKATLKT